MTLAIAALLLALAAANGSNDVPKGVATLAGAGVTRYRTAVLWGTLTTLAGSLCAMQFADRLVKLFSKGIISGTPTPAFTLAVLAGTTAWVAFATATRLPVSTTHALVGSMVGAGLLLSAGAVDLDALTPRVLLPLLASVGVAYGLSVVLNLRRQRLPQCVCVGLEAPAGPAVRTDGQAVLFTNTPALPRPTLTTGSVEDCTVHGAAPRIGISVNTLHWLSSGATSFARGLNDTAKIVAVGAFALVPAGLTSDQVLLMVAFAMAGGSLVGGLRIARRLGEGVVRMSHVEGFKANLTTAILVGVAANRGLPLSTTHVSTGAIAGAAGRQVSRINSRTLRQFVIAWTVTPFTAGLVAAAVFAAAR